MTTETNIQPLDMAKVKVDPSWALRIPANLATRRKVLPCCRIGERVLVACLDLDDEQALDTVERYVGREIKTVLAEEASLVELINYTYSGNFTRTGQFGRVTGSLTGGLSGGLSGDWDDEGDEDIVGLVEELLQAATIREASDIHIDPGSYNIRVRLRVDGVLEEYRCIRSELHPAIASRVKVLAGMDIAERRASQDGRFSWTSARGDEIDVRAATLPTSHGECVTLRLLTSKSAELTLESLGMADDDREKFVYAINRPHGMLLLTGPTGSGKSTTLYAGISRLVAEKPVHTVTVEDPIEYDIEDVAQVAVDSADKVSFTKALRSILRHDPDVIMIGEIRDGETADIAIKASLTGHLVLSTLHTNSAVSAVTRLSDMGVAPYLIGATLRLAVAQRLVRRLCPSCRKPETLDVAMAGAMGHPMAAGSTSYSGEGCIYCAGRGMIGRMGLFEMMAVDEEFSRAIASGADETQLIQMMRSHGTALLADDALDKVLSGETTAEEAIAAVSVW